MTTSVVVTGATRGLGFGLARAFGERGCDVTICGRSGEAVAAAVARLGDRAAGVACDVTSLSDLERLWSAATERFGRVDVWINNAGLGQPPVPVWDVDEPRVRQIVDTNLTGTILGSRVAMRGFLKQGSGALYNMEGFGSDGRKRAGMGVYGSTKQAIRYLTHTLAKDAAETRILVGTLSPGIVVTDLLTDNLDPADPERSKKVLNILADRVETVAPWLVAKVLGGERHAAWLTPRKAAWRFATAFARKRDLFSEVETT